MRFSGGPGEGWGETWGGGEDGAEERGLGGYGGRAFGKAGQGRSGLGVLLVPALVEVVVGNGLGLGGIELGCLIEVVWGRPLGGLFAFGATET